MTLGQIGRANLEQAIANAPAPAAYQGVVGEGSTLVTLTDSVGEFVVGQWAGYTILFGSFTKTAALRNVWRLVTASTANTLTLAAALPSAPQAGDTFSIRPVGSMGAAQDGTDATGVVSPAGATGIRGWLSSIYNLLFAGAAKVQATVTGSNLRLAGKATADNTDKTLSPVGGFNHVRVINDGATELRIAVDQDSTTATNVIYVAAGEFFEDDITGTVVHYSVASGTTAFRHVLR